MKTLSKRALALLLFFALILSATISFADQGTVNISATVVAGSKCWFLGNRLTTINLGNLVPGSGLNITGSSTLTFRCMGKDTLVYSITDDDGMFEASPGIHRLKHTIENEYIEYSFDYTPKSETITGSGPINITRTLTITATVTHNAYQNASAGNYYDVVTLTILP